MKAIRLKTEYLTEPMGLGIAAPRFYWNCEGGEKQTAYQIVCKCADEVIWDSGKVKSSSMARQRSWLLTQSFARTTSVVTLS